MRLRDFGPSLPPWQGVNLLGWGRHLIPLQQAMFHPEPHIEKEGGIVRCT